MKKSGYQKINIKLSDVIELIIGIDKEEISYLKAGSEKKTVTFKLFYEDIKADYKALKENKNVVIITKKSKTTFIYVSDLSEEELKEISDIVESNEEENTDGINEDLKKKVVQIINCRDIIRELKEKYDDIEQLIYVLKNQVNFMTFLYLFEKKKEISYENYLKVYDWYLNISQDSMQVKEYRYQCSETTRGYFKKQLDDITEVYNLLYKGWKSIKTDNKFSKSFFNKNVKKISEKFYKKITDEEIFTFLSSADM